MRLPYPAVLILLIQPDQNVYNRIRFNKSQAVILPRNNIIYRLPFNKKQALCKEALMYIMLQSIPLRRIVLEQLPALFVSFLIAELFYKFRSFSLECITFLVTWFAVDAGINWLIRATGTSYGN